jgi:hypothetical protein
MKAPEMAARVAAATMPMFSANPVLMNRVD